MKNVLKLIIEAVKIAISKISWNDLNDKPFVETIIENILLPETTVDITDEGYISLSTSFQQLTAGKTYCVLFNGVEYICKAREHDGSCILIGNGEIYGDGISNGEPFCCDIYNSGDIYLNVTTAGEYTISIYEPPYSCYKIDEKYASILDWNELNNKPFGEEYGKVDTLEEQTFNLEYNGDFNQAWIDIPLNDLVYVGNKYTVVFDGVEYEATLYEEEGGAFIGINYYYPTDNRDGLPFGLLFNNFASIDGELWGLSQLAAICTTDDSLVSEHTVSIYTKGLKINKIDEKYLPDSVLDIPELKDEVLGLKEAVEVLPSKMDKENPIGSGSLNMNGKAGATVGNYSTVLGNNSMSVGESSIVSGHEVVSNYDYQSVFGKYNKYTAPYELVEAEQSVIDISAKTSIWVSSSYVFDPFTGLFKLESPIKVKIGNNSYTNYYTSETDGWSEYIKKILTTYMSNFRGGIKIYSKATENSVNYALMIGNGTSEDARSNAHTIDWDGHAWYQGDIYVGSASGTNKDDGSKKLATEEYVDASLSDKKNKDLIVTITSTTAENGIQTYSADKTFEEIIEAYNNGASVYAVLAGMKLECTKVSTTNSWFGYFNAFNMIDHTVTIKSDNTISYNYTYRTAKANVYGGVKADTKSDTDTVPAKIGEDGKLYVPSYPTLDGLASEDYVSDQIDLVEQEINDLSTEIKNIDIPTNVSDLNNDSGFITRTVQNLANYYLKSETYSQEEINAKLSAIPKFAIQPVDTLPTSDISVTTVYLLKSGEESQNLYTEYIYVNNTWEYLGTQTVDLSGYALKLDIPTKLSDLTNDSGFITKNVSDLANYYKKTEVYSKNEIDAKKYLTEHQDLSAYAKTSQIPTKVSQLTNDSKFLTAIPNEYITESELEAKGYLTQHQDLSSYAKKSTTLAGYGITDGATKTELNKLNSEKIGQTELTNEVTSALQAAKDSGTFDGQDGDDGISCTHSWNGTTLTITSASGSSSANLKGEKGVSGVYVGSGDMPDGYNIQIDPEGDADYGDIVTREEFEQLSETIADQQTLIDKEVSDRKQAIADLNARLEQQTFNIAIGDTQEEAETWLAENGDTTQVYLMPDDTFWQYKKTTEVVENGPSYTNLLPLATDTDRKTIYNGVGFKTGTRLSSSSGAESTKEDMCTTGFISAKVGQVLRVENIEWRDSVNEYVIAYNSSNAKTGFAYADYDSNMDSRTSTGFVYTLKEDKLSTEFDAIRLTLGKIDENTIITLDEEIVEGGGTTTVIVEKWVSTGHGLVATNYDGIIASLTNIVNAHTTEIQELKEAIENNSNVDSLEFIRQWDSPIYDRVPTFLLDGEKSAITSSEKTVTSVYAKYDALMAEHPRYIRKTDLGMCSDGVTPVYRYDFCEPESRHNGNFEWSEKKPKFIVVTGIHREYNGIYSMYNALAEITTNSELEELRRNVHFIVIPVLSPYSLSGDYDAVGHALNANGVEIHRNFEVGFAVSGEGTIHYTGTEPLSEVETQYLDDILKNNTDASYFLTCHSFDRDYTWGTGFLWGSSATKYMCNLCFRVIDKMGKAWHKKYGTTWEDGIAEQNSLVLSDSTKYPNARELEEGDYRIGHAGLTDTGGCEQRQATKYGIQATNFEVCDYFRVLGDTTGLTAKAVTHGTEAYINFFLTAMGVYDHKDKKEYYK